MYDHDASLMRWMQRSRMLTALADKIIADSRGARFYYSIMLSTSLNLCIEGCAPFFVHAIDAAIDPYLADSNKSTP